MEIELRVVQSWTEMKLACDYKSHSRFAVVRFCNHAFDFSPNHGGRRRHEIRQGLNNFLSLVRNITKLPHRVEFDIPENPMFFVFRYCYILAGK